jgi:hypothetical protein
LPSGWIPPVARSSLPIAYSFPATASTVHKADRIETSYRIRNEHMYKAMQSIIFVMEIVLRMVEVLQRTIRKLLAVRYK